MAIAYPSFRADPNAVPKLQGVIPNIQKGYLMAQLPEKLKRQRESEQLQNQLLQEKINYMQNPASRFTGESANAYNLERLHQSSISDPSLSPYYDAVKQQYDQKMQSMADTAAWHRGLAQSMQYRSASPLGKLKLEEAEVNAGYLPHTDRTQALSPEQQKNLQNRYGLMTYKISTDPKAREKIAYVTNLDKTLSRIDPEKLTQYSGTAGGLAENTNKLLSVVNLESKNYDEFLKNKTDATLAAKQLRQFLGDTVQPSGAKKLEALTYPSTWDKNPKQAAIQLKEFIKTYRLESQTWRDLANRPDIYGEQTEDYYGAPPQQMQPENYYNSTQGNDIDMSHYSDAELAKIAAGGAA